MADASTSGESPTGDAAALGSLCEALFAATSDALLLVDLEAGRILRANARAEQELERSQDELRAGTVRDLVPPEQHELVSALMARTAAEGHLSLEEDFVYRRRDGTAVPVRVRLRALMVPGPGRRALVSVREVAESDQAKRRLDEAEARYRAIFDHASDPIAVIGPQGDFLAINPAAARNIGLAPEAAVGKRPDELFPAAVAARRWGLVRGVFETGEAVRDHEFVMETPAGERWFNANFEPVRDRDGGVLYVVVIGRDVTARREAEAALKESEERFRRLIDQAADAIYVHDYEGRFVEVNRQACELLGYGREELMRLRVKDVTVDFDRSAFEGLWDGLSRMGAPLTLVGTHRRKDGTAMPVEIRCGLLESGGKTLMLSLARDVSERVAREAALKESQRTLATLMSNLQGMAYRCRNDPEWTMEFVSDGATELTGYGAASLVGNREVSYGSLIHPDDRQGVWDEVQRGVRSVAPFQLTYRIRTADGEEKWVWERGRGVYGPDGELAALEGFITDITERRRAEEALRASEAHYRAVVEDQTELITRFAPDYRATFLNEALCRYYGLSRDEILGRSFLPYVLPEDVDLVMANLESIRPDAPVVMHENRVRFPDGDVRWVQWTNRGIFDESGRLVEYQAVGRDVTDRRRLEEHLREAQKMEAVGQLAGGIAHDFSNIITGVMSHAQLLKMAAEEGDEVYETADVIERAARRAADLTNQLLGFARKGKYQNVPVDVHETIKDVIQLMGRTSEPAVKVRRRLEAGSAHVMGDPVQMEQALLNLAVNARDAMPEGGALTFATREVDLDEAFCRSVPHMRPGGYLAVSVADTGAGIAEEVQEHIFEPFFTTKPRGRGTGMGLAMVYGIIRNHGGTIEVASEEGRGTTFTAYLPVTAVRAEASSSGGGESGARGAARILVVDDEADVRRGAQRMLAELGYQVAAVSSGSEAVAYCRRHRGEVDLVIIDLVMPAMDGRQCLEVLRGLAPGLRAILSTGYGDDQAVQRVLDGGEVGFVKKPYRLEELSAAVDRALGWGPGATR